MKILAAVPQSVLWVSSVKGVPSHQEMLRSQAERRGVDPSRLVFADRLASKADHFARHHHIGLFLDTLTLNASTTALDALWAGVPLLTVKGDRFSNRISNSMLHWVGLDEMVMPDLESYVARAIHLATHPDELAALRERLQASREAMPLFQTERFARHIEQAYATMWERYCRGEGPAAFDVPALPPEYDTARPTRPPNLGLQLHLNGAEPREGWKIVAAEAGSDVDHVCDPRTLAAFGDETVDAIYAGWYYQRLSYREELPQALAAAYRVLKPGGTLRLAVPDFELLCSLMVNPSIPTQEALLADGADVRRPVVAGALQPAGIHRRVCRRLPEAGRIQERAPGAVLRPLQRHEQRQALQPRHRPQRAGDEVAGRCPAVSYSSCPGSSRASTTFFQVEDVEEVSVVFSSHRLDS